MPNLKSKILNLKLLKGFTLIELIVSVGIFMIIIGFSSVAYLNIQRSSDLANQTTQLVSSLRQAQALAISGQTLDGSTNSSVGVHFEENSYTIFIGSNYDSADTNNVITTMPDQIEVNYNLPSSDLLFMARTGEIINFDPTKNTIIITHQNGDSKTIDINKLGVVNF